MAPSTTATSSMAKNKAMELLHGKMGTNMLESLKIMSLMVKEYLRGQIKESIMAPGSRTRCMAKALLSGQINANIMVTILKI